MKLALKWLVPPYFYFDSGCHIVRRLAPASPFGISFRKVCFLSKTFSALSFSLFSWVLPIVLLPAKPAPPDGQPSHTV